MNDFVWLTCHVDFGAAPLGQLFTLPVIKGCQRIVAILYYTCSEMNLRFILELQKLILIDLSERMKSRW